MPAFAPAASLQQHGPLGIGWMKEDVKPPTFNPWVCCLAGRESTSWHPPLAGEQRRRAHGTFVFEYYRGTDELVRLVPRLAESCGPLVLWHDRGGERSVLFTQAS